MLPFLTAERESSCMREDNYMGKIWTKCEHAKKLPKNGYYQKIQTNTCKNGAGKPVFTRGSRGYRRNERSPFRALTHSARIHHRYSCLCRNERSPFRALTHQLHHWYIYRFYPVEMKEARLGRWHLSSDWASSTITMVRRNERSPFRALTHGLKVLKLLFGFVEMKEARLGRWHNNSSHLPSEYFL